MIKVEGLTKKFPTVLALDHISFECRDGEVFGLLGPNGAGKTTTIRSILSILTPTEGRIEVDGVDVATKPEYVKERIGAVLEDNGIYDRLTAYENVAFFGELKGMKKTRLQERIESLFALLEMEEYASTRAGTFSKGMKQKVAVARALVSDPPVLVLDEPTAGLDVLTKRVVLKFVKLQRESGKCVLYSTHIMSEAEEVCDKIAIIHKGRIRAIGSVDDLRKMTGKGRLEDAFVELVKNE